MNKELTLYTGQIRTPVKTFFTKLFRVISYNGLMTITNKYTGRSLTLETYTKF